MSVAAAGLEIIATLTAQPYTLAAVAVVLWAVGYALACAVWPFTACSHCEGGKRRSPSGRAWRPCRRCGGAGSKVRLGRRLFTGATKLADKGRR